MSFLDLISLAASIKELAPLASHLRRLSPSDIFIRALRETLKKINEARGEHVETDVAAFRRRLNQKPGQFSLVQHYVAGFDF